MPKSKAGIRAITTNDIIRFESIASWTETPDFDVADGTKRNDSKPSNTDRKGFSFPPSSNCGFILSRYFLSLLIAILELDLFGFIDSKKYYYSLMTFRCVNSRALHEQCVVVQVLRNPQILQRQNLRERLRICRVLPYGLYL